MRIHRYKIYKRLCSAVLIAALAAALAAEADVPYARTPEQIRDKAKDDMQQTSEQIDKIKDQQAAVEADIKKAAADMEKLVKKMEQLDQDIVDKQAAVEQAADELVRAQETEAQQYEAMKLRIQYMYENSVGNSLLTSIFESDGIGDMLNRAEYVRDLYESDRELMESYQIAVKMVEDWGNQLALEMDNLLALQEDYEQQQNKLDKLMVALDKKKADYATQLANAQKAIDKYRQTIIDQERIIREREAAAARAAAAQYEGGGTGAGGLGSAAYLKDASYNPEFKTDVSSTELVNYALQFVGNPYRWGGNSLTNGCDCSGFVHLVYQHFGISTPRYSQSFKTVGQPVAYENIKPGDVVVYPGHVAIYIGNGLIVEAQSTRAGITRNRSVNCHTITAIRRLL